MRLTLLDKESITPNLIKKARDLLELYAYLHNENPQKLSNHRKVIQAAPYDETHSS